MSATFEDLRILKLAEEIADEIWKRVVLWDQFAKDVVGTQSAKAADSIGANIAESFGRFHFGEKLQFLYYARGSLFETKYWLNRARERTLMPPQEVQTYATKLTDLARQLNTFSNGLKSVRYNAQPQAKILREAIDETSAEMIFPLSEPLFAELELNWLAS